MISTLLVLFCISCIPDKSYGACHMRHQFECYDNTCIPSARVCDGNQDCDNGEDEHNCDNQQCKMRNLQAALANGYTCKRRCTPEIPCRGLLKQCQCDDECGYSCVNRNISCPDYLPKVKKSIGHKIIRFGNDGNRINVEPGSSYMYGDMIKYECRKGMKLVGILPRCTSRKSWSTKLPKCIEDLNPCRNVQCQNGGTCVPQNDDYVCMCLIEYGGRLCESEIKCRDPTIPNRAYVLEEKEFWIPGESAAFQCLEGFELFGEGLITCTENATWINGNSRCIGNICRLDTHLLPRNVLVQNYKPISLYNNIFEVGETVIMECKGNRRLMRNGSIFDPPNVQCDYGGEWRPAYYEVSCENIQPPETTCGQPVLSEHLSTGDQDLDSVYRPNATITLECQFGFWLLGSDTMTCLSNGTWSETPFCEQRQTPSTNTCGIPVLSERLSSRNHEIDSVYQPGDTIIVECQAGFRLLGTDTMTCLGNGTWTNTPRCEQHQPPPTNTCGFPVLSDSLSSRNLELDSIYEPGNTITVECQLGFRLLGSDTMTCLVNGTWTDAPGCERDPRMEGCRFPDLTDFLVVDRESQEALDFFEVQSILRLSCPSSHKLYGPTSIICRSDGTWSTMPLCEEVEIDDPTPLPEIQCERPVLPERLAAADMRPNLIYYVGDTLIVECEQGFELIGFDNIVCLPNGSWTEIPTCQRSGCQLSLERLSGDIRFEQLEPVMLYGIGEEIQFSCINTAKYAFSSAVRRLMNASVCSENENWVPPLDDFICVQVCGIPRIVQRGMAILHSQVEQFYPNETLYPECPPNHRHRGNNQIKCLEDGSWDEEFSCEPLGCWIRPVALDDSVTIIGHTDGSLNNVEFAVGHELEIQCVNETDILSADQPPIITCKGLNVWSNDYMEYSCVSGMTCSGRCLSQEPPCPCDLACVTREDCCPDFRAFCEK